MKWIRLFQMGLVAGLVLAFSACKREPIIVSGSDNRQIEVNSLVKDRKKHNQVILLVAYGSAWEEAYNAYELTIKAYKDWFPDHDVFLAFSSDICINIARAGANTSPRIFYNPQQYLYAFAQDGVRYKEIVVQSLQVIPSKEYDRVFGILKDFANHVDGDIDEQYLSEVCLRLGAPLLTDPEKDVSQVAKELDRLYQEIIGDDLIVFMAHGVPEEYDTYQANVRFTELEAALQKLNPHYFVGTLDVPGNYKTDVYRRMDKAGYNKGNRKVFLHPLLAVYGTHAHDYMFYDESDGTRYNFADLMAEAGDGDAIDYYWQEFFDAIGSGVACDGNSIIRKGLLDLQGIQQIWIDHTKEAMRNAPLDFGSSGL